MESKGKEDFLLQAEQAAEIVSEGIDNGDYYDVLCKLDKLSYSDETTKEQYIYNHDKITLPVIRMVVCGIFCIVFLYFAIVGIGTAVYSRTYFVYGISALVISSVVIIINVALFCRSLAYIKFCKRYDSYLNLLKYHTITLIDDLNEYSKEPLNLIIKDLKKAIKLKLIPQGHFGRDNIIFILSDSMYYIYQEKRAIFDRYYRKLLEGRNRMSKRTKELKQILDSGQRYVEKIHECNDLIQDKVITKKLDKMEEIVTTIFNEVDINPEQADKLGMFLNYYMPTTEKLLEAYIDIDEKKITGENLERSKKEIEEVLDTINASFESILNKFYQEQELDIVSDISAMETMMEQEKSV